jgi:gag-polypeptide of LTR copia-type
MGAVDIKVEQLDESNWGTWSKRMKILLAIHGLEKMILVGLPDDASEEDVARDAKAKALIAAHLSNPFLGVYNEFGNAKRMWDVLVELFVQKNMSRRLSLRRELTHLFKLSTESLSAYVARAKSLREELAGVELDVSEDEVVLSVLAGLPPQYEVSIEVMTQSGRDLSLDDCLRHLMNVEHKLAKKETEPSAFFTRAASSYRPAAAPAGGSGVKRGAGGAGAKRAEGPCWYCGKAGHIKRYCRKWITDGKPAKSASVSFATAHAVCAVCQAPGPLTGWWTQGHPTT